MALIKTPQLSRREREIMDIIFRRGQATALSLGYLGIFLAAFIASTLLPAPSELIVLLAYEANYNVFLVLTVATKGNVLGSLTNYYIGYVSNSTKLIKRFKKDISIRINLNFRIQCRIY